MIQCKGREFSLFSLQKAYRSVISFHLSYIKPCGKLATSRTEMHQDYQWQLSKILWTNFWQYYHTVYSVITECTHILIHNFLLWLIINRIATWVSFHWKYVVVAEVLNVFMIMSSTVILWQLINYWVTELVFLG